MRLRKNRRFIVLLLSYLILTTLKGQTLYWVGGNGNFNDPNHWSLTSGGPVANQVPNSGTSVIFNDQSSSLDFNVIFTSKHEASDFTVQMSALKVGFSGSTSTKLQISNSFFLSERTVREFKTKLTFNTSDSTKKLLNFGKHLLNSDVEFVSGNWDLKNLFTTENNTVTFQTGVIHLVNTRLIVGNFIANTGKVHFLATQSLIRVKDKFIVDKNTNFETANATFDTHQNDPSKFIVDESFSTQPSRKFIGGVNTINSCTLTLTSVSVSCFGSNDGYMVLYVDPSCATGVYTLTWNNPGPIGSLCADIVPSTQTISVTSTINTFTFTGMVACPFGYDLQLVDASNNFFYSNSTNIPGPTAINLSQQSVVPPTCLGLCNGTYVANLANGTAPYNIIFTPPTGTVQTFTNQAGGVKTFTGLCAGVQNFSVTDANGCSRSFSLTIGQPSLLVANPVTTSITCIPLSNGAFAVSPSGGNTGGYTVNFSTGATSVISSGAAIISGLANIAVSATVTDTKGCSVVTSTVIAQPAASLTAISSKTDPLCGGVCSGVISATASGGTAPYQYAWSVGTGTAATRSGLCQGTYTLAITDANGCTNTSQALTIVEPSTITAVTSQTNVVCSGSCTGIAAVSASGGQNSFSYTWVGPLSTNTILTGSSNSVPNLCSSSPSGNTYTVFIKDANNCLQNAVVTITQPSSLSIVVATQSITCFGANNGAATVTASGGNNSSYTYIWSPTVVATTSVVTGLSKQVAPTPYTVTVFDAALCPISTTFAIQEPTGVTPNVTFSVLTCNAANAPCNGRINAAPTGGTGVYSYTLTSSTSTVVTTTAPPYNNLCAGIYSLVIKDGGNCTQTVVVNITQPNVLLPTVSTVNELCFGGTTGGLSGNTGTGGSGIYTTFWTTPTGTASANPLNNQPAGVYIFHVTDSKTCTSQATATITQPSSITIAVSTNSISCFSVCNGVLNSTVSGGSPIPGYSYTWTNSSNVVVGSAATATALCPGLYTLTAMDGNSCIRTATTTVFSPSVITSTVVTNPVACFGDSNGSATITPSGGTPSFTFSFNSAPTVTNTTGILTGQPTGTYIATVTDNNNCVHTNTLSIGSPTALAATLTGAGSCNVCSGTATVAPFFGTGAYSVSWASSVGGSFPTTQTLSSLCPGSYTATVTDAKGCVVVKTITLTQVVSVTVGLVGSPILCNGALTGTALAQAGGGSGVYTYSWSTTPTQTTSVLSGVGVGTYTVRVTDTSIPSTCSHTASITFNQPAAISITLIPVNVTCNSFTNGAITASVSGGTTPYSYTWSPSSINSGTNTVTGLAAGGYTLNVRDNYSCPATKTISITQPNPITISITKVNPSGCTSALANGSVHVTGGGGAGFGFTYTLNPGTFTSTTGNFTGLGGGAYSIIVRDGALCSTSTVTTLAPPSAPNIAITTTAVACSGYSTGVVSATASGITASFNFSWTPAVPNSTTSTTTKAINLPAGVYVVTAADGNGCIASQAATVTEASAYTVNPVVSNLGCFGAATGSIVVSPAGGSPAYTYSWLPSSGITGQGTATVTNLVAGVYTLNLSDTHTCVTPFTFTVTQPLSIALTGTTTNLLCYTVCAGAITASASGGAGYINYSWAPSPGTSSVITNLCANTGTTPIIYTVTATDGNTCSATQTFVLTQPTPVTTSINVLSATCSNSCNAVATQTASGGASGYSFSWSSSTLTGVSLGSLCAGIYTAYVTDTNSCTTAKQFTITPPAPLSVTLTPSNPLCNAACNGSINTAVSGAQGSVTYSWFPSGSGQNPTGLCATITPSPIYTLVATDQNSCKVIAVVTLANPPSLKATVNSAIPLCHNGLNGSATVSLSNAVGAGSYTWMPSGPPTQTTQIVTGLSSGAYTVLARDGNSCTASQTFTLANPSAIVVNSIVTPATCSQSNGAITANPSGGTPGSIAPYTYSWTGVVSSASVVSGLGAGSYTVNVYDGLGCTTNVNVLLSNSNGPSTIPVFASSITCNSQCTGAASVDISGIVGGTPPYTSSWISPASTNSLLTNLCTGSFVAQIVDATGCIGFTTAVIAEPLPIVNTPTIALPLCPGICNGSVTLGTTGGNTPYTYSWIGTSSSTSVVTNLCAGDYTVVIGYNGVCTDTTRINLPDQSSITIVPTVTNVICFGGTTGSIDLTITGGTSPYTAGWNNGNTGFPLANISAGNYTAVVTDGNGCSNVATASVTEGAQIVSSTAISSPSCGVCNGTASITASGGTGPFTYNWSTSAATPTVDSLCAGIYQVIVTDNLACAQAHTVIINNSNGITGENFNVQQIPCSGSCVGAATVSAVGGTSPISYNWINPVISNSIVTSLCPGTYFVQMSDAMSCIRIASVTINPQITLTVSPFVYLPFCAQNNGSISIVIAGGTPSYNIVWNPPAGLTTSLTSLNAGMYSYTVTESGPNACAISNTINLSNTNAPVIQATQSNINCFNACTGSIATTATGTNTPIQFLWSNASTSPTLTNLCKGPITLTVTDFGGCKAIQSFTLSDNPALQLGLTNVHNSTCYGDCNGSINLVPNGGVPPYTYTWTLVNANTNPISSLCDGVYTGTVTDAKGCIVSSNAYSIQSASALSLTANTSSSSCSSVADGSISLSVAGGQTEYTFVWSGPSNFSATTQNIINIYAGAYSVNVTDNLGCSKDSILKIVPSLTVTANAGNDKIICPTTGTVVLQASSTSASSSFKWYDARDIQKKNVLATGGSYLIKNLQQSVNYVLVATSSVASCYSEDSVTVDVFNLPPVDAGRDHMIPIYSTVTIGGHPASWSAVTLTWTPALYLDDASITNPVASNTVNVTYTLTVSDANGCIASDTVQVLLYPKLNITSGFTPNGDGKNDTWVIDYIDQFPATTVDIFNRWGDSIFSSTGYMTPFDGKYKGSELPVGTYYYVIKLNHPGYPKPITGPLTIFR